MIVTGTLLYFAGDTSNDDPTPMVRSVEVTVGNKTGNRITVKHDPFLAWRVWTVDGDRIIPGHGHFVGRLHLTAEAAVDYYIDRKLGALDQLKRSADRVADEIHYATNALLPICKSKP